MGGSSVIKRLNLFVNDNGKMPKNNRPVLTNNVTFYFSLPTATAKLPLFIVYVIIKRDQI